MNDEGWTGGDNFSEKMWSEMEEIMEFRSLGYSNAERLSSGQGDTPAGGPGGGIATWYKDDADETNGEQGGDE
jgi:hypothetical protein